MYRNIHFALVLMHGNITLPIYQKIPPAHVESVACVWEYSPVDAQHFLANVWEYSPVDAQQYFLANIWEYSPVDAQQYFLANVWEYSPTWLAGENRE